MSVDVVTIGESMVLFQPMQDGPLQYASLFQRTIAGAESNVSIGLTRLGKKVRWVSRLGQDPFGDVILSTLSGEGIDTVHTVRDPHYPTAIYFKAFKGYGDPLVYYYRRGSAASRLRPEDVRDQWFEGARVLHVTGITPALGEHTAAAMQEAMRRAKDLGLVVSFDPNLRRKLWDEEKARTTLLQLVRECDIFLPGQEEAEFLLGRAAPNDWLTSFAQMGPKVVAVKLGENGSVGWVADQIVHVPGVPAPKVVDTVGAGDAFASGFLSVWLDEERLLSADNPPQVLKRGLTRGNLMGSLAVQYKGDWEGLPTLTEVERLQSGQGEVTR